LVYAVFVFSAVVSGGLFALFARASGVEHVGILVAIAIIGGGLQMAMLIGWYLHHTASAAKAAKSEQEPRFDS
jgi:hypothetical protein